MRAYTIDAELLGLLIPGDAKPAPGEQRSGQWFADRLGKLTASRMAAAMSYTAKGKPTAERTKLMMELCAERLDDKITQHVVTEPMRNGLEREPAAKRLYERVTGRKIIEVGFVPHPTIQNFGASPDGLVDDDGLVEIKCPTRVRFLEWISAGVVPEEHKPQMITQLLCTQRIWCDFAAYNPDASEDRQLFVRRFVPSVESMVMVSEEAQRFLGELDAMFDAIVSVPMVER